MGPVKYDHGEGINGAFPINQSSEIDTGMATRHCRTIRYRLHPHTKAKAAKLHGLAEACRITWNHFVGKLRDDYRFYGKCNPRFFNTGKLFVIWRKHYATWLQHYSMAIVRLSLKPIETAYKQFYAGKGGLPKFKGQYDYIPSFPLAKGLFKLTGNSLRIQRIGQVSLVGNNPYPESRPMSGIVKYECGHWYAYIVHEVKVTASPAPIKEVGIDRNVGQITCSDGEVYRLPQNERMEARKRRYERIMAQRQAGNRKQGIKPSNRYLKARRLYQGTHKKIVQARMNWCHHVSKEISQKYNLVYLEDLNTAGMTASAKGTEDNPGRNVRAKAGLNKSILQSGWGRLQQYLSYKSNVIKVPAPYTSQRCSKCGYTEKDNRKTQADFACVSCDHRANADVNAALNILASGNGATARGDCTDVGLSVKREIGSGIRTADFDT